MEGEEGIGSSSRKIKASWTREAQEGTTEWLEDMKNPNISVTLMFLFSTSEEGFHIINGGTGKNSKEKGPGGPFCHQKRALREKKKVKAPPDGNREPNMNPLDLSRSHDNSGSTGMANASMECLLSCLMKGKIRGTVLSPHRKVNIEAEEVSSLYAQTLN